MSELLAAFPKGERSESAGPLPAAGGLAVAAGLGSDPRIESAAGATVCVTTATAHTPALYASPDGAGWIAVKGFIFDVRSERPHVDLESLWRRFVSGQQIQWNDYEGTFALVAWDAARRVGVAVNDHMSHLNLYVCEDPSFVFATTAALPLARALARGLDAEAVREFLARGALIAPTVMFEGFRRLTTGEHLVVESGALKIGRHWRFPTEQKRVSFGRAAEEAARAASDRVGRYGAVAGRMIFDLTSGFDSRLLASAADHAGLEPTVTVNGVPGDEEVRISRRVADAAGWPFRFFDRSAIWTREIDPEMRRALTYRTDGNLPFTELYHHALTRPHMKDEFDAHAIGIGGELYRYHAWQQEFFGIGRRRPANIDRLLDYRVLQSGPPPRELFVNDWYPGFRRRLHRRLESVCRELPGSLTNQQLDAAHIWRETGHSSLYVSLQYSWLPSTIPLFSPGFLTVGLTAPWRYRLTTRFARRVIHLLCPRAAGVVTRYGATAGPVSPSNLHLQVWQPLKRVGHMAVKLDRVVLGGAFTGRMPPPNAVVSKPWITEEARAFLSPAGMRSAGLYDRDGLSRMTSAPDPVWRTHEKTLLRVATIEQLCRELDFTPEAGAFQL